MERYIEEVIQRKIKIFDYLIFNHKETITKLTNLLDISTPTLYKELEQMNQLTQGIIEIKSGVIHLNITSENCVNTFRKKLYSQSDFLTLLNFYLLNTKKNILETTLFPISRSKLYNIKNKIKVFLNENNLNLKNKKITGSYLKINWLKAILSTTYGFESLPKNTYIFHETHKFVQEINNLKNCYLTSYEEKIYFYHLLLILDNPINIQLTEKEQHILERIIVPPKLENSLKNFFTLHSKNNNEILLNYSKLCFFLLSSHVFSPKINTDYKDKVVSILSKYAAVNALFTKIEQEFDIRVNENEIAMNILYNHIKLYMLDIQNLIQQNLTNKNIESKKLFEIFIRWNKEHDLSLNFSPTLISHLNESLNLVTNSENLPKLYIYTDSWIKYVEISTLLKKKLPFKVSLIDHWLNSREELLSQCQLNDLIISDNYFFINSCKHSNTYYLPSITEDNLSKVSLQIAQNLCKNNFTNILSS